jgi:WD40 repeat protein
MAEDARSQEGHGDCATTRRSLLAGMGALLAWPQRARPASAQGQGSAEGGGRPLKIKGVRQISIDAPKSVTTMAWAPDSRRIAVGGALDRHVSLWDARTGKRLPGPGDYGPVRSMAYSSDGRYLALDWGVSGGPPQPGRSSTGPRATGDYSTSLWDGATGAWVQNLVDEVGHIRAYGAPSIAFSPDSRYLAVAYRLQVAFYAQEGGFWKRVGGLFPDLLEQVVFSPDGTRVAGVNRRFHNRQPTGDATVKVLEVPSARVLADWVTFTPVGSGRARIAYRPDGREIAASHGPQLAILDASNGNLVRTLEPDKPYDVTSLSYMFDGRYLAVASRDMFVYETTSWTLIAKLTEHGQAILEAAFSPDGTMIAAVAGNPITIWDAAGD